jgi:hypothetical protein
MKTPEQPLPKKIDELKKISLISLYFFLVFAVAGAWLLYHDISYGFTHLDISNLDLSHFSVLPTSPHTAIENFISGASLSMPSGFWLTVALAGYRLRKAYRYKAYQFLNLGFYAQIGFFLFSIYGIFAHHKYLFNPGTLGTFMTILFTLPIFIRAQSKIVKKWSEEYEPPAPDLSQFK